MLDCQKDSKDKSNNHLDYKRHSGRTFLYLSYACAAQGIRMENTEEEIVSDRWRDLAVG